jgi:hypothetical protein
MAKHCTNCGLALRETDKFCAECGTPVGGSSPQPVQYETCKIDYEYIKRANIWGDVILRFFAEAFGPRGTYVAGQSAQFVSRPGHPPGGSDTEAAFNDLIGHLMLEGWEPFGRMGMGAWYSHRFRRPVKR